MLSGEVEFVRSEKLQYKSSLNFHNFVQNVAPNFQVVEDVLRFVSLEKETSVH